jgi:hypothetical protein
MAPERAKWFDLTFVTSLAYWASWHAQDSPRQLFRLDAFGTYTVVYPCDTRALDEYSSRFVVGAGAPCTMSKVQLQFGSPSSGSIHPGFVMFITGKVGIVMGGGLIIGEVPLFPGVITGVVPLFPGVFPGTVPFVTGGVTMGPVVLVVVVGGLLLVVVEVEVEVVV